MTDRYDAIRNEIDATSRRARGRRAAPRRWVRLAACLGALIAGLAVAPGDASAVTDARLNDNAKDQGGVLRHRLEIVSTLGGGTTPSRMLLTCRANQSERLGMVVFFSAAPRFAGRSDLVEAVLDQQPPREVRFPIFRGFPALSGSAARELLRDAFTAQSLTLRTSAGATAVFDMNAIRDDTRLFAELCDVS